ncbi:MAG: ATPase, T2SS/T4P/T4SS family [bacterium]
MPLLIFSVLVAPCSADQIRLKNGRVIQGRIIEETAYDVTINVSGTQVTFARQEIAEVKKDAPSVTASQSPELEEARQAVARKDYVGALSSMQRALAARSDLREEAMGIFNSAVPALYQQALEQQKSAQYARSKEILRYLLDQLQLPATRGLFDAENLYRDYVTTIKGALAESYLGQANLYINNGDAASYARAEEELFVAKELNPSSVPIVLRLGYAQMRQAKYEQARQSYHLVLNMNPDLESKQEATQRINEIYQLTQNRPAATPAPTSAVRATPIPTATPPTYFTPSPPRATPTPEPGPLDKVPWIKTLVEDFKQKSWGTFFSGLPEKIVNSDFVPYIVYGLIFALFYWVVPLTYLKHKSKNANILAAQYRASAKLWGIFALILYFGKVAMQKSPKKRCPFCGKGIDNIEDYRDLNFLLCPHCKENISPVFDLEEYVQHLIRSVEQMVQSQGTTSSSTQNLVEKDAMLKLVRALITLSVRRRASDLHLESQEDGLKFRARVDGMLFDMIKLPKAIMVPFISALKIMANLDITERRMPQDGRINLYIDKKDIDVRLNTAPASMGENVVMRLLDQRTISGDSTKLGLEGDNLEKFERAIRRPSGLVLVTGPSGSGKTTTLYVALNTLNTGDKNIITIEDPVEYQLKGISQQQVNLATNFTFATGLRSILRQDPDVIMVGEIRDKEAADIAIEAAMTGHMVFSTLHTIDTASAITRLKDLGVQPRRYAAAIISILAQRLVRVICPDCKKPCKPKKEDIDAMGLTRMGKDQDYYHGSGCDTCNKTGYCGRTALFEILMPTDDMKEILETDVATSVIRELARKNGMRTLREEGILKVVNGVTTVEEVLRVTN